MDFVSRGITLEVLHQVTLFFHVKHCHPTMYKPTNFDDAQFRCGQDTNKDGSDNKD